MEIRDSDPQAPWNEKELKIKCPECGSGNCFEARGKISQYILDDNANSIPNYRFYGFCRECKHKSEIDNFY